MTYENNMGDWPFNPSRYNNFGGERAHTPEQIRQIEEASRALREIQTEEQCIRLFELTEQVHAFAPETALLLRLEGMGQLSSVPPSALGTTDQHNRLEDILLDDMKQVVDRLQETPHATLQPETTQALLNELVRRAWRATKTVPIILSGGILVGNAQEADQTAQDELIELGLRLQLNSGSFAWSLAEAHKRIQEEANRDVLSAREAHELGKNWPTLPSLVESVHVRVPQAGLNYVSDDPIPHILLDAYLFFVAEKKDGVAVVPEKPIKEIIDEIKTKGGAQTQNEKLYISLAAELQQWYDDGAYHTFVHSLAEDLQPYQGYESSSFFDNSIVVRKDHDKHEYMVNNAPVVTSDDKQPDMLAFATACNKLDRLMYVDPPDFTFTFGIDEQTAAAFDVIESEEKDGSTQYLPVDINFTQLVDFCSKVTGTELPSNFYEQLQARREDLNQELASPTHWAEPAEVLTDEVGLSLNQSFNDEMHDKKPELLPDGNMRIWVHVGYWNGGRHHELPELRMSTYRLFDKDSDLFKHFRHSAQRAAIFKQAGQTE